MRASLPAIEVAYRGRVDMLRAIFGGSGDSGGSRGSKPVAAKSLPAAQAHIMTPEIFGALFSPAKSRRK